jgi:Flp pilus assembly protein TadD
MWAWHPHIAHLAPSPAAPCLLPTCSRRLLAAALRALELDPTLADAHALLGNILQQDWQWSEAEARLRRALELNPSHARAHAQLGWWLLCRGRAEEAIVSSRYGRELDPLAEDLHVSFGVTLYNARHYDEAIRERRSLLAINPGNTQALMMLGLTLVETGRFDEAVHALELGASRSKRSPMMLGALAGAYGRGGHHAQAVESSTN